MSLGDKRTNLFQLILFMSYDVISEITERKFEFFEFNWIQYFSLPFGKLFEKITYGK